MNKQPINTARDTDLRLSQQAMQRARELAAQTGTAIVISRNGVIEQISPKTGAAGQNVQEPAAPCGDKP
jgi:hypothetical protein